MQVRRLGFNDASEFQVLRLQALQECPSAFASSYEEECETPAAVVAERLVTTPDRSIFGAFHEFQLMGSVALEREGTRKLAHKALIWGLYVAPAFRKQGVGRQLVARALQHAAAMPGVRQVNLSVNAANQAAISLYEAMGFKPFGVERGFMLLNGELHDEVHMARILEET